MLKTAELFAVDRVCELLRSLLAPEHPWEVLVRLDAFVAEVSDQRLGRIHPTAVVNGPVYLAETAVIYPHAYIEGPAWIGEGAEVGHGAFVRGGVVLAPHAKVGHATEVKRSLFLEGAKAPHFNYVGDAVVGRQVNLGAGVRLANLQVFGGTIRIEGVETGLRKFSAAIGDEVSIGCNAVVSPGTLIGPRTVVYNGAMLRGIYPADSVVKLRQTLESAPRR